MSAPASQSFPISPELIAWLMESDPSLRWQVMRDLLDAPAEAVQAERDRVPVEGWGKQLLESQDPNGGWGGGAWNPGFDSTMHVLTLLKDLGVQPSNPQLQAALAKVRQNLVWTGDPLFEGNPYFDGEVEACINAQVAAAAIYFGQDVSSLMPKFLGEAQLEDGGWNCDVDSKRGSFNSTFAVLDALWEYEQAHGPTPNYTPARLRGEEYLLERQLFKQKHNGSPIAYDRWVGPVLDMPAFTWLTFPHFWPYDILRGLDYFRKQDRYDPRMQAAARQLLSKRNPDGTWNLDIRFPGHYPIDFGEEMGQPSRWVTFFALRVLKWLATHRALPSD